MAIFKVIFSNRSVSKDDVTYSPQNYTYRIEADSADEAVGLAQIEFSQKLPQLAHADYVPHATTDDGKESRIVQTFAETTTFNSDP